MAAPANERGQMLLAEEYFATENPAFIETLRGVNQPKSLAALADRWKKDPRPWARSQALAYLAQPLNRPGHQPVVRRLFKQAEAANDYEMLAAFLVAFDRQVRRQVRIRRRWDSESGEVSEEERLFTPRNVIPLKPDRQAAESGSGSFPAYGRRTPKGALLFRYRSRYYLRRRAWRCFRHLGYRDPATYPSAIARALAAYEDADLQRGENILDSWGLMHACFGESDSLEFSASRIQLKDDRSLGELAPAPRFLVAWKKPEAAPVLLTLAVRARARLVRVWAMQLFLREHPAHVLSLESITSLLDHEDAEVQQFGARLLEGSASLGSLPIASWLKLLQARNEEALQRICDAFARHVSGDRLDLAQCVALAVTRPVPVARLGQRFLRERIVSSSVDRSQLIALAGAKCRAVGGELATWALGLLGNKEHYACDPVSHFFDSGLAEVRVAAWDWLVADSPGLSDPSLWSRLTETPHDDLRLRLIDFLEREAKLPGADAGNLDYVWRSVLLGVHRGGRQKTRAVQQIARTIVDDPARGEMLLPVLAVAVRSVRGPEARAGLAAVVGVVEARPQLADAVKRLLPEMKLAEVAA